MKPKYFPYLETIFFFFEKKIIKIDIKTRVIMSSLIKNIIHHITEGIIHLLRTQNFSKN